MFRNRLVFLLEYGGDDLEQGRTLLRSGYCDRRIAGSPCHRWIAGRPWVPGELMQLSLSLPAPGLAPLSLVFSFSATSNSNGNIGHTDGEASEREAGGPAVPTPSMTFQCPSCGREFSSARGLGVHKRRAHPVDHHREEAEKLEARLEGFCNINQCLASAMPTRTIEAIKGKRRDARYKTLVEHLKTSLRTTTTERTVASQVLLPFHLPLTSRRTMMIVPSLPSRMRRLLSLLRCRVLYTLWTI